MTEAPQEFSTEIEEEIQVKIDGTLYSLKTHPSTPEVLRDRDRGEELQALMERRGEDRTEANDERIVKLNSLLISRYVDAPSELLDKLPAEQQAKLAEYVTKVIKARRDPTDGGDEPLPA